MAQSDEFKNLMERGDCPVCGKDVALIDERDGRYRIRVHGPRSRRCSGSDLAAAVSVLKGPPTND